MRLTKKKAQSVLEYTIILAAIIGAIIVAAGLFKTKTQAGYENAATIIDDSMTNLKNSLGGTGGGGGGDNSDNSAN